MRWLRKRGGSQRPKLPKLLRRLLNPTTLTVGTIALVVLLFVVGTPVLDVIELNLLDLRFRTRGPIKPLPTVVLAAIDERSLAVEGRWPWRRSTIAKLVDKLSDDGAHTICFDVQFAEPDDNADLALVDALTRKVDSLDIKDVRLTQYLLQQQTEADNDQILAKALKRSKAPVVLGYFFHMRAKDSGLDLRPDEVASRYQQIAGSKYPLVYYKNPNLAVPFIKAYAPQNNLPLLTRAAASSGYFSVATDADGTVRWMPLVIQGGDELFPSLSVMCAWHHLGEPPLSVRIGENGVNGVQIGDRLMPTDENGQMLINYRGPAHTFQHYSISDILLDNLPKGTFLNKIVIVGATAIGIGDLRSTPFGHVFPGPEVHANVIDNMLAGDFIERPHWSGIFDVFAILVLGATMGVALPRMSAIKGFIFATLLVAVYVSITHFLFVHDRVWLNMVYPILALAATYTVLTVYRYVSEERERKRIKETFKQYVSADVIEEALKDPEHLRIGGQEKLLTVLFSDLAGFTAFSEGHTPSQVIDILSEYHDRMTERLFEHQGTLIGYIGDELIALWGAPVEQKDQAQRACAAALAMLAQRNALGDEWVKMGRPRLRARTGINTGTMLVGNIGSKYRFTYSVLGDHVNLASRLEQINKVYGTEIIVGEDTARLVSSSFVMRRLDVVRVVGRKQALGIFELIAAAGAALAPEQEKMLRLYAGALDAYRERRFEEALAAFGECRVLRPTDGPSRLMIDRCRLYQQSPPPESWDGAFEHVTKS
ncbi:MAG TPA: adenylate/guanylate cyclase domain-containing protein [Casimicrobiaceae bacterium]